MAKEELSAVDLGQKKKEEVERIDRGTVRGRIIQHGQTTSVFADQWRQMMANMGMFLTAFNLYQISVTIRATGEFMTPSLAFELFSAGIDQPFARLLCHILIREIQQD
jgi:hypothetical protein